jgi:hypothetical protein
MHSTGPFQARWSALGSLLFAASLGNFETKAIQHVITIQGTDAIFIAGRTDVVIPPANEPFATLIRHGGPTPEEAQETFPSSITVAGGDIVKVFDPGVGGVNFFNGFGPPYFGPEGAAPASSITSLGGISGYIGTQGALVGVFLDNSVPSSGPAPATLDFSSVASRNELSISPGLGQVFFIGDGQTSSAVLQQFIAPAGATRLFFGIPDGFGFLGAPGAYDDNDGSYQITVGINEEPSRTVPDGGSTAALAVLSLAGLGFARRRSRA